jgi:hypothetical protein
MRLPPRIHKRANHFEPVTLSVRFSAKLSLNRADGLLLAIISAEAFEPCRGYENVRRHVASLVPIANLCWRNGSRTPAGEQ